MKKSSSPFFVGLQKFFNDPFDFVDNLSLKIRKFEFNIFRDDVKLRKNVFRCAILTLLFWLVAGFDSSTTQLELFLLNLPGFVLKKISWSELVEIYNSQYGLGFHWSAFVIYGLMFWGLSKYYSEKLGLKGSRNIVLSFSFTFLSISLFEHFWHFSYYYFQNQPWIIAWLWPQLRILVQVTVLSFVGVFVIFMLYLTHGSLYRVFSWRNMNYYWRPLTNLPRLRLNFNGWSFLLLLVTFGFIFLWWFYPFPVEHFTVDVIGGSPWTNTRFFPQTVYTVETNLIDNINAGDQFWFKNDLLHLVNTVCKIFFTLTIYSLARLKRGVNESGVSVSKLLA